MNRTRLLMIGAVALGLGIVVSLFVYRNLQGRGSSNSEPGADVIVAADDIQVGARIEEHDVRIVKYPASALPAGTLAPAAKCSAAASSFPFQEASSSYPANSLRKMRAPACLLSFHPECAPSPSA
jgi:Flp pilus assembly protein CpaB